MRSLLSGRNLEVPLTEAIFFFFPVGVITGELIYEKFGLHFQSFLYSCKHSTLFVKNCHFQEMNVCFSSIPTLSVFLCSELVH